MANSKYEDIINMQRHVSKTRKHMAIEDRAMQFAPFAALTGYDDEVKETVRLTDEKIEISNELKEVINEKLIKFQHQINENKISEEMTVTYFEKDSKKDGGKYEKSKCRIKRIDEYKQLIILENEKRIYIEDIIEIN